MLWAPFLMKKLLKNEVYGFCEQCTRALFMREKSTTAAKKRKKKKKKKEGNENCETQTRNNVDPNGHLRLLVISLYRVTSTLCK